MCVLAPGAFASTASVAGSSVTVKDVSVAGEANNIDVKLAGPAGVNCAATSHTPACTYTITDTVGVTAGAGCATVNATTVTCSDAGTTHAVVDAGKGDDVVTMEARPPSGSTVMGRAGRDILTGGPGRDWMYGGPGDDTVSGGPGNDVLDSGTGGIDPDLCTQCFDDMDGGVGNDTITYASRQNPVLVDEHIPGRGAEFAIDDDGFSDGLFSLEHVIGGHANDQIYGSVRNDILDGGPGADTICGGWGNDTVDYSTEPAGTGVNVSLDPNPNVPPDTRFLSNDPTQAGYAPHDCRQTGSLGQVDLTKPLNCTANDGAPGEGDCVGADTENVIGTDNADVLIGNDRGPYADRYAFFEPRGDNRLDGRGGNDFLDGRGGADVLDGGDGVDTVSYAWETLPVKASLDGAANDGSTFDVNADSFATDNLINDENIVGGQGDDSLVGDGAQNNLQGGPGNDVIQGGDNGDNLDGGDGNDSVQGQNGDDQVHGGAGDDTLVGGFGADTLGGGDGSDTADYSDATTPVSVTPDNVANDGRANEGDNVGDDVEGAVGGSDADTLTGNAGNGTLTGNGGDDTLDGGGGADSFVGGTGIDTVSYASRSGAVTATIGGTGGEPGEGDTISSDVEKLVGGGGADTLTGDAGVNLLFGGPGNDKLSGGAGADQLFGGGGDDTESGDQGDDTVNGGDGNDNLQGGSEADNLNGDLGDDSLDGGAGKDTLTGGPGLDVAVYTSRTKDVRVRVNRGDDNGEAKEQDFVRASVEGAATGSGDDSIDLRDGVAGKASCGKGTDVVNADSNDTVSSDCEQVIRNGVAASGRCSVKTGSVRMSGKGVIKLKVSCLSKAKGTLRLRGKVGHKQRTLASKKFSLKSKRSTTLKVKLNKKGRSAVKHSKRLRARVRVSLKGASTSRSSRTITIKAPRH